jgi:hypothetical protein
VTQVINERHRFIDALWTSPIYRRVLNIADLSACFEHCEEERSSDDRYRPFFFTAEELPFAARFCLATPDVAGTCTVPANRMSPLLWGVRVHCRLSSVALIDVRQMIQTFRNQPPLV